MSETVRGFRSGRRGEIRFGRVQETRTAISWRFEGVWGGGADGVEHVDLSTVRGGAVAVGSTMGRCGRAAAEAAAIDAAGDCASIGRGEGAAGAGRRERPTSARRCAAARGRLTLGWEWAQRQEGRGNRRGGRLRVE